MIKCEVTARNFEADEKIKDYVQDKVGSLEKFLPRGVRDVTKAAVVLEEDPSGREDNRYVCEVVLTVRGTKLVSREATINMYAAIDIVEAKLKAQVARYKEKATLQPRRLRMLHQVLQRFRHTDGESQEQTSV